MFVRIKKRGKSGEYGYLVENFWVNRSSRQRIKDYLGKAYKVEAVHDVQVSPNLELKYKELVLDLIKNELLRHGFQEKDSVLFLDKIFVNLNLGTMYNSKGRKVVIKINDGHLCDYYLQELLNLKTKDEEKVKGIELANLLVSSGLKVNPESFVELYTKLPFAEKDETVETMKKEVLKEEGKVGLKENKEEVDEFLLAREWMNLEKKDLTLKLPMEKKEN